MSRIDDTRDKKRAKDKLVLTVIHLSTQHGLQLWGGQPVQRRQRQIRVEPAQPGTESETRACGAALQGLQAFELGRHAGVQRPAARCLHVFRKIVQRDVDAAAARDHFKCVVAGHGEGEAEVGDGAAVEQQGAGWEAFV